MPALAGAAPARLRLADEHDTITVRPVPATSGDPVACRNWDPGAPEVREDNAARAGIDGTDDVSAYTGRRAVTLELQVFGDAAASAYDYAERLAAMAHPSRRPHLYASRVGQWAGEEWRLLLRGNPFSVSYGRRAAAVLELSLAFTAPLGYWESPLRAATAPGGPGQAVAGLVLPTALPVSFHVIPAADVGANLDVRGSVPVPPTVVVYGPSTNPEVHLYAEGQPTQVFAFANLVLESGQFVVIDMQAGAVLLNGQPDATVHHTVDWAVSSWWQLPAPAQTRARLVAGGGRLYVQWRDRRMTI